MATGTVTVFNQAKAFMVDGDWASTDTFNISLHTGALPSAAALTPSYADYSGVEATGGVYTAGGETLTEPLSGLVTETGGVMTFTTADTPSWASGASTAVTYALIYNADAVGEPAICFIELGSVDMTAGSLTINVHANGLFTVT